MLIDNSIRKRWGFLPQKPQTWEDSDTPAEMETSGVSGSISEESTRFRVSAKEWLCTWRAIE